MATALLTGKAVVQLPARTLTLVLEVEQPGVQADFDLPSGTAFVAPRPGMLVIDDVPGQLVVAVAPRLGGSFPSPTVAHLTISTEPEIAGFDGDRIIVPSIDAAGSGRRELVTITRRAAYYHVERMDPEEPIGLSPIAEAVRVTARQLIGADRVPHPMPLSVVVDTSASMASAISAKAVNDAVEVLAGVATVVTSDNRLSLFTGPSTSTTTAQDASRMVQSALEASRRKSSFAPADAPAPDGAITFIVTDGIPPGIERLEADEQRRHHLVLLCPQSAAVLLEGLTTLPVTNVDVSASGLATDALLTDAQTRRLVVRSLLRDFLPVGAS
jgi:hypothetical protein